MVRPRSACHNLLNTQIQQRRCRDQASPFLDSSPTRPFPDSLIAFYSVLLDQKHPGDNDSVRRFTVLCTSKSRRSCRTRLDSADNSVSRDWLVDRTRIVGASARKGACPVFPFHLSFKASPDIAMTLEDSWGGDVTTAAIAHLAHSTPDEFRFSSTDFNSYVTVSNATGSPQRDQGFMQASEAPGLGIEPRFDVLGKRLVDVF